MPVAPELLRARGLFAFDEHARAEIDRCFEQLGEPPVAEMEELVCLTAAELALEPLIADPVPSLPVRQPIAVERDHAAVAVLKADCNPLWCPPPGTRGRSSFTLADVTAFGGDTAKLTLVGLDPMGPPSEIGAVARALDALELEHRNSPVESARRLGESGVLRLQGFLWAVKLALPALPLAAAVRDAYEAFELAHPVGGIVAGT